MKRAEAIKQIESLFEHCEAMMTSDEPVWSQDCEALKVALSALRGPTREQVERVWRGEWIDCSNGWMCSRCEHDNTYAKPFCPNCGAPMTDQAVDMVMNRLEALRDE